MDLAVGSLVYAFLWYVPGLFIGLAELEIENLGWDFWARNLITNKIIQVPCLSKGAGTTYHLFFFGALLATLLAGFLTTALFCGIVFSDLASAFLTVLSAFVMIAVIEDNTWYIYRTWSDKNNLGFSRNERAVRYSVATLLAFGLFCAGQCGRTGECSAAISLFWVSVAYYLSFVAVLDNFILYRLYVWARDPESGGHPRGSDALLYR